MSTLSTERRVGASFLALLVGLIAGVATSVAVSSLAVQAVVVLAVAALLVAPIARRVPTDFDGAFRRHRLLSALWLAIALLAAARVAGLAMYMADANHPQASPMWFDSEYVNHSCFSAGWKATQLNAAGTENIYDDNLYDDGHEGRFELDDFIYPPQFLILPQALQATGGSFLQQRAAWFVIEGTLFAFAILALCRWIGGATGRRAALWSPAIWLASPVLVTLQVGNFQIAALSLSVLAMVLFDRDRPVAGGALLGFALIKVFPGVLCAYLLFSRRWRPVAWTAAFFAVYTALAYATAGPKPFHAFVTLVAPQMSSGELWWSWLDLQRLAYVNAINDSVPALLLKLKQIGLAPGIDHQALRLASSAWSVVVVVCAWVAARRGAQDSRWRQAACWIALLGIASLRSPFVPDHDGLIAGVWLWWLVATAAPLASLGRARLAAIAALWVPVGLVLPFSLFESHKLLGPLVAWSTTAQLLMIALMLWTTLRRGDSTQRSAAVAWAHRTTAT